MDRQRARWTDERARGQTNSRLFLFSGEEYLNAMLEEHCCRCLSFKTLVCSFAKKDMSPFWTLRTFRTIEITRNV